MPEPREAAAGSFNAYDSILVPVPQKLPKVFAPMEPLPSSDDIYKYTDSINFKSFLVESVTFTIVDGTSSNSSIHLMIAVTCPQSHRPTKLYAVEDKAGLRLRGPVRQHLARDASTSSNFLIGAPFNPPLLKAPYGRA